MIRALFLLPLLLFGSEIDLYNLGTESLAEERWQEAMDLFQQVPEESTSPLLGEALETNLAFALFKQGKLSAALVALERASTNHCAVAMIKGTSCKKVITPLRIAIKRDLAAQMTLEKEPLQVLLNDKRVTPTAVKKLGYNIDSISRALREFYVEDFLYTKRRLLRSKEETPRNVLENGIFDVKHLIFLNRRIPYKRTEENTLEDVAPFVPAVIKLQKRDPGTCQEKPWDEVMPLFEEGLRQVKEQPALTLIAWQAALNRLDQAQNKAPSRQPIEQVIQTIEEMERQDRPIKERKVPRRLEGKPW